MTLDKRVQIGDNVFSKDEAFALASRPRGYTIHIYKHSEDRVRKQFNRYYREGIVDRQKVHAQFFCFRLLKETDLL